MRISRMAIFACFICLLFIRVGFAQEIEGSTSLDIDASSGTVTATCETDLDSFSDAYYSAQVHCGVYDTNNNLIAYGTAIDSSGQGFVQVVLTFTGVPGMTYSAIGSHVGLVTFNEEAYSQDDQPIYLGFDDAYNFSSFAESALKLTQTHMTGSGPGPIP